MSIEKILLPVNQLKLWNHQKDAVRSIIDYYQQDTSKSYLVKMPTGTGKTGVFAALTRIALPNSNYIVITPSKALKFQIVNELKEGFWKKIGYDIKLLSEQTITDMLPSEIDDTLDLIKDSKFIIVTTIQALQTLSVNNIEKFEKLRKATDYLIFDEGHKEPAYTWGETVRSFKKPTVLFSATPYRNDYKIFNISKENFYLLAHNFCTENNILRGLEIKKLNLPAFTISAFLNELITQVDKLKPLLKKRGIENPKVIIRCERDSDAEKVVAYLNKHKRKAIGIHENFSNKDNLVSEVPKDDVQAKYEYFVHQFKLVEGIDNPEFCIIALHANFTNSRMLIQQIGRVLRNPTNAANQFAYVFTTNAQKVKEEWNKYIEYDSTMTSKRKLFDITDILKVNKEASTLYFSGTFRELVDVNNISLKESILFQTKINVLIHDNTYDFDGFSKYIIDQWSKSDYSILKTEVLDDNKLLILYIIYSNSPLVKDGVFIEQKLALTYFQYEENVVYFYDSEQNNPWFEMECVSPATREMLINAFNNKKRLTKVFLSNTDISNRSLRSKEYQSGALESSAPGLADNSFFPTRMEGYVSNQRRYLGIQFGKISDYNVKRVSYKDFQVWLLDIQKELNSKTSYNSVGRFLGRFSEKVEPPLNTTPVCILLDLDDDILENYSFGDSKQNLEFDDLCSRISYNQFSLTINNNKFTFIIKYDAKRKKYLLSCQELDQNTNGVEEKAPQLVSYINSTQAFRIILQGNKYVYASKSFFKPGLNFFSKKKELDLRQILNPIDCINKIKSEKGSDKLLANGTLWHRDSLFGLIAGFGKGYGSPELEACFTFDYMICDDLVDEIADFICLDTINNKIVLIHAKAGASKLSASAFQEVCGQATKNLDYLNPFFSREPQSNILKWGKKWSFKSIGTANRIIVGKTSPKAFWNKYKDLLSNPSTVREVWLFVGNVLEIGRLDKELSKTDIESVNPETIQLIYLLRSTWSSVSSVGAQLKIFC